MACSLLQNSCVEYWSWDRNDQQTDVIFQGGCNPSITFNKDEMIYGTNALNSDWHYWEVKLENPATNGFLGNTSLGVVTAKAVVDSRKRKNYSLYDESWMQSTRFSILNQQGVLHQRSIPRQRKFPPAIIGMFLDRQQGTLSYYVDGEPLGVKYRGLEQVEDELFPAILSNIGVKATLFRRLRNYHSLQDRCRGAILKELLYKCSTKPNTDLLPLPTRMKDFLNDGLW